MSIGRRTAILLLAGCLPFDATAAPVILKIATLAPEGSAWMQTLDKMKSEVEAATGGAVRFRIFPGGIMGEELDVLMKIRAGQLDGGGFLGNGIARICPEANALMVPMTFANFEEVDAAMDALSPWLAERCLANGYVVLGWTEVGFSHMMGNRPIRRLDDFRGAKVWSIPNDPMLAALFSQAGVSTIPVPVADVLAALQTGLLDTVYAPPLAAVSMQWTGRIRHVNKLRLSYSFGGLFVVLSSWNRIPPAARETTLAITRRLTSELTSQVRRSNEEALALMLRSGVGAVTSDEAAIAEFQKVSDATRLRFRDSLYPAEADERLGKFLQEFRASRGTTP